MKYDLHKNSWQDKFYNFKLKRTLISGEGVFIVIVNTILIEFITVTEYQNNNNAKVDNWESNLEPSDY